MDKSVANVQIAGNSKTLTNQHRFYHYTTFHFILQYVLFHNQLMSTKKQIFSLCKFYSVYKEKPEKFLEGTNVDSYFYNNFLDISQFYHRIVRVSKGSNKNFFCIENVSFLRFKVTAAIYSQGRNQLFLKGNWVSTRQLGWISQSFRSSKQSITDSITKT